MADERLDLNLLAAFAALYEARSVTAAARRQGIGQPAMSAALARLRRLFGDELFVRVGARMEPTPRAETLGPRIAGQLAALRAALAEDVAFEPRTARRRFTVIASDSVSIILMPRVLAAAAAAAPGVDLRILSLAKDDALAQLERGEADLVIGTFRDPPQRLLTTTLWRDRFIGIARRGHPLLAGAVTLEAWLSHPHALFTLRGDTRGEIDDILARRGRTRRVALSLPHLLTLPTLLSDTDLLAAIPSRLVPLTCGSAVATFPLPVPAEEWRVTMLASPATRRDRARTWLRDLVRRAAAALPQDRQG